MVEINNFPNYFIDKHGNIFSTKKKKNFKKMTPFKMTSGYLMVKLWKGSKTYPKSVHRLVLEAFIGLCPEGMEACHNNGVKTDNRLDNLRWDTLSNNQLDRVRHGTDIRGDKGSNLKLNSEKVKKIKNLLNEGKLFQREIAKIFGVSRTNISNIKLNKTWFCLEI
jgi:predicted XRE-type DNA-binding protein